METKYLVLCDIDDSLFRSNTTFDFLDFVTKPQWMRRARLRLLTGRWSPLFLMLTFLGLMIRRDLVKQQCLRLLAGMERKVVERIAFDFYDAVLSTRLNIKVWELVIRDPASFRYLVSSTLDPVAKVIASRLGVEYRASLVEEDNGRLTGRLLTDLSGRKQEVAHELKALYPAARLVVITDNPSDRRLVEMADERFVVLRKDSDESFWSDLHPSYIQG